MAGVFADGFDLTPLATFDAEGDGPPSLEDGYGYDQAGNDADLIKHVDDGGPVHNCVLLLVIRRLGRR